MRCVSGWSVVSAGQPGMIHLSAPYWATKARQGACKTENKGLYSSLGAQVRCWGHSLPHPVPASSIRSRSILFACVCLVSLE